MKTGTWLYRWLDKGYGRNRLRGTYYVCPVCHKWIRRKEYDGHIATHKEASA